MDVRRACMGNPVDDPTRRRPDISRAKELLGWESETSGEGADKVTFKDSLFTDYEGHGVRLMNNAHNRDFDEAHAKKLAQSILNKQYQLIKFAFGKATSFAPICSGKKKLPRIAGIPGMITMNTMMAP